MYFCGFTTQKYRLIAIIPMVACVAGVNEEGEGEQERGRKIGDWGLGMRERLLQRPDIFKNSDWLMFDSKSHGNDVI